jgi:hydrogenase nickel incorporation protein HypB
MSILHVNVKEDIRKKRFEAAESARNRFAKEGTLVVRLISSPGSGKTALLEKTAASLNRDFRVGVLVGDIETERDARRLSPHAPTIQITTGGACHLELSLIEKAGRELNASELDFLFIEDIGNLICPASHDLGEHLRGILLSVTEGDDKPGKYPKAFRTSDFMVLSKIDLLPYLPFSTEAATRDAHDIQPNLKIFQTSAMTQSGLVEWIDYLIQSRENLKKFGADASAS